MAETPMTVGSALKNALRLSCPRCGRTKLFARMLTMVPRCEHCGLDIAREPGYYLGSTYINYGVTTVTLMVSYISLRFGAGIESRVLIPPLVTFLIAFPLLFFRHARALWLAMDTLIDRSQD